MVEDTKIEWAHHTLNPWEGCTKVGPGCDNCYAENRNARFGGGTATNWGPGAPRRRTSDANWRKPLQWDKRAAAEGVRYRVFCASLADWLDNEVPIAWLVDLLDLIRQTPHLDWLLLSKRIGNWESRMRAAARYAEDEPSQRGDDGDLFEWIDGWLCGIEPKNVWLGATVINQQEADRDIPKLLSVPARVRWLSMEPLLGPVVLQGLAADETMEDNEFRESLRIEANKNGFAGPGNTIGWIVVGGESGPGARPMHPDWARSLRDQCVAADVPFLFKQWGDWLPQLCQAEGVRVSGPMHQHADGTLMGRAGKKAAGRHFDGELWDQYPEGDQS